MATLTVLHRTQYSYAYSTPKPVGLNTNKHQNTRRGIRGKQTKVSNTPLRFHCVREVRRERFTCFFFCIQPTALFVLEKLKHKIITLFFIVLHFSVFIIRFNNSHLIQLNQFAIIGRPCEFVFCAEIQSVLSLKRVRKRTDKKLQLKSIKSVVSSQDTSIPSWNKKKLIETVREYFVFSCTFLV